MPKPADRVASLAELRFKPANSNDAARAVLSHQFVNVPRCSFARDDGISPYLGAETGMDAAPASPDMEAPANIDVPAIQSEMPETGGSWRRKLLRDGFALSIFLHAAAAIAMGYATFSLSDEPPLEEGTLSVTFITEGTAEVEARSSGTGEDIAEEDENPNKADVKPIEKPLPKPVVEEKPVVATSQQILRDVQLPELGADLPEILATRAESKIEAEVVAKSPIEKKVEKPVEEPKTPRVVEKPVEKKPEEKKVAEEKKQKRGDQGNQAATERKGDVDSRNTGRNSTNSRGDSANPNIGNAARTNYRGLVNRKLARAKGRMQNPAKGKVTVHFTILASGAISGLTTYESSGKKALDDAALKIVRNASPFPPIPAETGKKSWGMTVEMVFTGK